MRTPKRVKQKMFYSTFHAGEPIYDRDDQGDIIYDVMPDGERIPRILDTDVEGWDKPIEFWNSITGDLTEAELELFGTKSRAMAKMTFEKGIYPFVVGVLIWKDTEPTYKEDGTVDENSADYRIVSVQTTGRKFHKALLEEVV